VIAVYRWRAKVLVAFLDRSTAIMRSDHRGPRRRWKRWSRRSTAPQW